MSFTNSPEYNSRYSHEAFEPLNRGDATVDIPLEHFNNNNPSNASSMSNQPKYMDGNTTTEKQRPYSMGGVRRAMVKGKSGRGGYDEETQVNNLGKLYEKILSSSIVVRYLFYILPLAIVFAIPMIIGATIGQEASLGGVRIVWIFAWLLVVWVGLWVSKVVAHYLPNIFQFFVGFVSPAIRKYALMLKALEIPLSLAGAALVALSTFIPIMSRNPDTRAENNKLREAGLPVTQPHWETVVQRILAASMIAALIFLGERTFIQFISINYHRKQFAMRIRESKNQLRLLALMYDASRTMFPAFCAEFAEEDAIISDTLDIMVSKRSKKGHVRSGSHTPMRLLRDVGRFGDKITSAFGNVAQEITGKEGFNPTSANSIVIQALERNRASEALARRLWLSFAVEGHESLYMDDFLEVLGPDRQAQADACFSMLDLDGNGDITIDEMIMQVTQMGRDRKAIANSMHDVDQAINVLDRMLCGVIFIVIVFIYIAFLNESFVTTLATAGTALLSLSFVFSVTCQEILGSCIFLFVKHPFDIGDRVDLNFGKDQFIVEHISLLFTVFRRITNHRTVQIPNIVLNTLWVENVSRSKAMREQITLPIHFDTTIEDIQLLRNELSKFVTDKDNSRDFQPDVEIEVDSVGSLDKLDLIVDLQHKSNWSNETVRAARRSKFMCALVLALRKVPIYGPGCGAPALGEIGNPNYAVTISEEEAAQRKAEAAKAKDAARMVPASPVPEPKSTSASQYQAQTDNSLAIPPNTYSSAIEKTPLSPISENRALETLNERSPGFDQARDDGTDRVDGGVATAGRTRKGSEAAEIEEMRGMLRRVTTQGKRRRGDSVSQSMTPIRSNDYTAASAVRRSAGSISASDNPHGLTTAYSAPPMIPPVAGGGIGSGQFGLSPGPGHDLHQVQSQLPPQPQTSLVQSSFPQQQMQQQQQQQQPLQYTTPFPQPPQRAHSPHRDNTGLDYQRNPSVAESTDLEDFRGDYYDETEEQGRPPVNAGTAYSAGQWRRGA